MVVISIAVEAVCLFLKSDFIVVFLTNKLVEMQITLMAINTATSSFIASKLQEIAKEENMSFKDVYCEIKTSLFMQIALIVFSVICLMIKHSEILMPFFHLFPNVKYVYGVLLIFSFSCSLDILRDTGAAMFNILIELDAKPKSK
jgi:hypothetical protein